MFYLKKLRDNIYNRSYYESLLSQSLKDGFRYYLKMSLWLVLAYTAFVSVFFLPNFINVTRSVTADLANAFPSDLLIHLQNGRASVNLPEPIIVPLPSADRAILANGNDRGVDNLLVIDTRQEFQSAKFDAYKSIYVLTGDTLGASAGKEVKASKIPSNINVVISSGEVKQAADKIRTILLIGGPLLVLVIYVFGLLLFVATLGFILLVALLAWLLLLAAKRKLAFSSSLTITLHAITLSLVLNFFLFTVYPSLSVNFPFMVTLTLLVIYLNLIRLPKTAPVMPTPPKEIPKDTITKTEEKDSSTGGILAGDDKGEEK